MSEENKVSLISGDQWVNGLKNLGITTKDAVCELIDNSLDAGAKTIHLSVLEQEKKKITLLLEDDGRGIPKDKIDTVLSFGGRIGSEDNTAIGKFGWGLSASITCQTNRGEIYSKTKGDKEYSYCYIDLDELIKKYKNESPFLPEPQEADPFKKYPLKLDRKKHGTIVVLKDCKAHDLDWPSKEKIVSELIKTIGESYRKFISGGISFFINEKPISPIDPLLLMPNSLYAEKYDKSKEYRMIEIEMNEVVDPDTSRPAKVRIQLAMIQPSVAKMRKQTDKEIKVGMSNQGFYLMRHDRQIGRALTLGLYTRNAHFNFLRGEISFPACLDSYFGIQTNKNRYYLKEGLKDKIREAMKGIIGQMESDYQKANTRLKNLLNKHKLKESEIIAAEAIKVMKKPNLNIPKTMIAENEKRRTEEKEEAIKKIDAEDDLNKEEKEEIKKEIENQFQSRMPFKMSLEHIETGNFYLVRPLGNNQVEVVLNTAHPFYKKVYEAAQEKGMAMHLDLMIFTLAKAEMDYWDVEDVKKVYDEQKAVWSALLSTFLSYTNHDKHAAIAESPEDMSETD